MSSIGSSVEVIEKNKIKLTIEISPKEFQKGLQYAYNRNKSHVTIQGFRKGKAPRKIIERFYGKDIFYEEALNHVLPDAYENAIEENNIEPVYRPDINVESMDEADGAVLACEVYVKPKVEISNYEGLTYPIMETEPTEDDIQDRLQQEREKNVRTVTADRQAQLGDTVAINFTGYIDGEPFEGGTASDFELTLGTKSFIDTFEDQLVGHGAGDDVEVNVTFPEGYAKADLRGKPAMFKVEILEVQARELPELDDEFAQDVSEFETLEEYQEDLIKKIKKEKEQRALITKRSSVVRQLVEKTEMDIPEAMYTARIEEMTEELRYRLWHQGLGLEQYLSFTHMTLDELHSNYQGPAKEEVEARLVLEAVAKKEDFEISDEEFRAHIQNIILQSQSAEEVMAELQEDRKKAIIQDLMSQKALDFLVEKAVAVEEVSEVVGAIDEVAVDTDTDD